MESRRGIVYTEFGCLQSLQYSNIILTLISISFNVEPFRKKPCTVKSYAVCTCSVVAAVEKKMKGILFLRSFSLLFIASLT